VLTQRALPAHEKLVASAEALVASLQGCDVSREDSRRAWRTTQVSWSAASIYRFEAQTTDRLGVFVNWWPTDASAIDSLASGDALMTADELDALGSPLRGLGALEVLLFADAPLTGRRCSYAAAIAADIATRAHKTTERFRADIPALAVMSSAVTDVLAVLADAIYRLGVEGLGDAAKVPLKDASKLREGPGDAGSASVRAQVDEINAAYETGLLPLLRGQFRDKRDPLAFEIRAVREAADVYGTRSLHAMFADDQQSVYRLANELLNTYRTISTSIAGLLGVTLVPPVGDGD
jgi:predicted lipoprotein